MEGESMRPKKVLLQEVDVERDEKGM